MLYSMADKQGGCTSRKKKNTAFPLRGCSGLLFSQVSSVPVPCAHRRVVGSAGDQSLTQYLAFLD